MYGRQCEDCGAFLDPGEKCDCKSEKALRDATLEKLISCDTSSQYRLRLEVLNEKMATA